MLRDFLICLSLANLCFLGTWYQLQKLSNSKLYYFRKAPPDMGLTFATALFVIVLAVLGFLLARSLRGIGSPLAFSTGRFLFLLCCIPVIEGTRSYLEPSLAGKFLLGAEVIVLAVAVFWNRFPAKAAVTAVFLMWPLYFLALGHQLFIRLSAGSFEDKHPAASQKPTARKGARSVWLIFDEFDQHVAFERRPARLRMPNVDRLRNTALYARQASPPGRQTIESIPGLLTGQRFPKAHAAGADKLMVTVGDGTERSAWAIPNLFSRAKALGLRVGIIGWYHPYCRVAGAFADLCIWEEYASFVPTYPLELRARSLNLAERAWLVCGRQLRAYPAALKLGLAPEPKGWFISDDEYARQITTEVYYRMHKAVLSAVQDPTLDVVYVHWPIPHLPGLIGGRDKVQPGYLDNLGLADTTIGDVRRALESSGLWSRTMLLVASDHSFRPAIWDRHVYTTAEDRAATGRMRYPFVPFLLKLAGQEHGIVYEKPLNLTMAADLTLAVLAGRLTNTDDLVRWLDRAKK